MIEVKDLVKQYGNHKAVDHLSFTLDRGQVLGFLGPNGAGKSTTMNIITGYLSATEGTVKINGYDIMEEPEKAKKSIGYLPEIPPLYTDMTVSEYLKFVADIKQIKKTEKSQMIDDIMELTKITDMANRLIKHLSKGYKQRVGLAGAIMGYPELIILDEPTVGLDPMQIIEIRDLIKQLSKEHTIILSSHILSEVSAVCDQVMIINKGKLVVTDTPQNLTKHMEASSRLYLAVKGENQMVHDALAEIDGVISIIDEETAEEGVVAVTVESEAGRDIRETVFYKLAKKCCPIFEMRVTKESLEEVFLALTADTDQEGQQAEQEDKRDGRAEESAVSVELEENEIQEAFMSEDAGRESEDGEGIQ